MAGGNVRAEVRMAESLPQLQIEAFTGQTGIFLAVNESWEPYGDENSPVPGSPVMPERVLRSPPRLPLLDLTHLYCFNRLNRDSNIRNAGGTDRIRRRPLESPIPSKKRRVSDGTSPIWDRLSTPAIKSPRPSSGLRSFR
ncbi:hypothetical protein R1flu_022206 [Riccia fluitans]|uniref:Uncharacterized protein n=1 Tax=Riccia fluitans TaxID=41844 RepID=A0ABD1ZRR3_9MARC